MKMVLRLRKLWVQSTWCKPAHLQRRHAAAMAVRTEEPDSTARPSKRRSNIASTSKHPSPGRSALDASFFTSSHLSKAFAQAHSSRARNEDDIRAQLWQLVTTVEDGRFSYTPTIAHSDEVWRLYRSLSPYARRHLLSVTILRKVLERVAPRQYGESNRQTRYETHQREAQKYESRLKAVIANIRETPSGVRWQDFEVALVRLARYAAVESTEAIYGEMIRTPARGPTENIMRQAVEARSAAINKWLKSVAVLSDEAPVESEDDFGKRAVHEATIPPRELALRRRGQKVLTAMWAVLGECTSGAVKPRGKTISLITSNLSLARQLFPDPDLHARIDNVLEVLFKQVYGLNLPYMSQGEGSQPKKYFADIDASAVNAIVGWKAGAGDVWGMTAAAEVFGDKGEAWEPWLPIAAPTLQARITDGGPTLQTLSESPAETPVSAAEAIMDRAESEESDYGPTLAEVTAAFAADRAQVDWRGQPKSPSVVQTMMHDLIHPADRPTAIDLPPDTSNRQPYEVFAPSLPMPADVAASASTQTGPIDLRQITQPVPYGLANNVTMQSMAKDALERQDLRMLLHNIRMYSRTAAEGQAQWIHAVVTRHRWAQQRPNGLALSSLREEWERRDEELQEARKLLQLPPAQSDRGLARLREETLDAPSSEHIAAVAAEVALQPALNLLLRQKEHPIHTWMAKLQPPPIHYSTVLFSQFHSATRGLQKSAPAEGLRDVALKELDRTVTDAIQRLEEEHVILTGRLPTGLTVGFGKYLGIMRTRPADEVDDTAPFTHYLLLRFFRRHARRFSPARYCYDTDQTINRLRELLVLSESEADVRRTKKQRRHLTRKIRASLPGAKKTAVVGFDGTVPLNQATKESESAEEWTDPDDVEVPVEVTQQR